MKSTIKKRYKKPGLKYKRVKVELYMKNTNMDTFRLLSEN